MLLKSKNIFYFHIPLISTSESHIGVAHQLKQEIKNSIILDQVKDWDK